MSDTARTYQTFHAQLKCGSLPRRGAPRACLERGRKGYVHVARGRITVNGQALGAGDALKTQGDMIRLEGGQVAEVLVFDLPSREARQSR